MNVKVIVLLFVILLIGLYLEMEWLIILSAVVLVLFALASAGSGSRAAAASRAGAGYGGPPKQAQDTIYPIVYEDVGETPWLYPPFMKVRVRPHWHTYARNAFEDATIGLGKGGNALWKFITGKPRKKKED